jgi:hypothetical protein
VLRIAQCSTMSGLANPHQGVFSGSELKGTGMRLSPCSPHLLSS